MQADEIHLTSESAFLNSSTNLYQEIAQVLHPSILIKWGGQIVKRKDEFRQPENKNSEFFADEIWIGFWSNFSKNIFPASLPSIFSFYLYSG